MSDSAPDKDYVVILHGIARTYRCMRSLAEFLEASGYQVLNVGYPSTRFPLEPLIEHINQQVVAFNQDHQQKIHFVGYSMGGLLARGVINRYRPPNLGRVVQLASPNQGSEVANFWKNNFLYKWIFGPAGQELCTNDKGMAQILGLVDFELGVVAGNWSWDPISSAMIKGPDDGKVSVESTKVPGLTDHIIISASHTFIIYNRMAWNQTLHFLKFGKFDRSNTS